MEHCPQSAKFGEVVGNDTVGDEVVLTGGIDVEDRVGAEPREARDSCGGCVRFHKFFPCAHVGELLPSFLGKEAVVCSGEKTVSVLEVNTEHLRDTTHPLAGNGARYKQPIGVVGQNGLTLPQAADIRPAKRCLDQGVGREA